MAIQLSVPVDEFQLNNWVSDGYTHLRLYYSNTPEGPYSYSSIVGSPSTFADAITAGTPYIFTFSYPSGNAGQWFKVVASTAGGTLSSLSDSQAFHGGGGTTLQAIREKIGRLTGTMHLGTTTSSGSGGGSTAICTSSNFVRFRDDYFGGTSGVDGWYFYWVENANWTVISDWVQSTGTFTFSPVFSAQVTSGSTFEVMTRWTPDEYRDAINWAIANVYPLLSKPIIDTNTLTEQDIFVYPVPSSIRILNGVEIESDTNQDSTDSRTYGQPWRKIAFENIDDGLLRNIEFKRELIAGRRLRFTGTTMLSLLYNDSDYTEVLDPQVDLIVYLAAHRLYYMLCNLDASSDIDRYKAQGDYYLSLYTDNKQRHGSRRRPKTIWSHDARWAQY